jgi:CO/xanthine dehydrogenase Mo-binding subunit
VTTYGQVLTQPTPVREVIEGCRDLPLPPPAPLVPGGAGRASGPGHVRRGVGYAVVAKNLGFSEGHVDESTATCELRDGAVTLHCACAEVGQGFVTVAGQIAGSVLGVSTVDVRVADTLVASAGSTSASRQTMASGTAVHRACVAVRDRLLAAVARDRSLDPDLLSIVDGQVTCAGRPLVPVAQAAPGRLFRATERFAHPETGPLGGDLPVYIAFGYAAQRAVVDVDVELGLVRVVQVASCQDVGAVVNPAQLHGQVAGGIVQGLGFALMEDVIVRDGLIRNPDLQDYLIPTTLDAPPVLAAFVEVPQPGMPFGWKGAGEMPLCAALPAVAAAVRDATGLPLPAAPIRPEHIALRLGAAPLVTGAAVPPPPAVDSPYPDPSGTGAGTWEAEGADGSP